MRKLSGILFFFFAATQLSAQYFDTVSIYYNIGDAALDKKSIQIIDTLIPTLSQKKLLIYSYADYLGQEHPNLHLSASRANVVKNYLLKKGIKEEQILQSIGLGQLPTGKKEGGSGVYQNRRTDIFIRKTTIAPEPEKQKSKPDSAMTMEILPSLEVGQTLNLKSISFYPGSSMILPVSMPQVDELHRTLTEHPSLKIRLEVHVCCCFYPDGYFENTPTWGLSVERARVIYQKLVEKGIHPSRLQYKGFGRTRPILANEKTSEEGQVNRRVEIRILEK